MLARLTDEDIRALVPATYPKLRRMTGDPIDQAAARVQTGTR
ncbi:hypothetical protein [Bradyrhizobium sp. Bra78]|nr:hypothetical protein [Bradyrhizobium sp. Bra78]